MVIHDVICDGCGEKADPGDIAVKQEYMHWRMTGGYGSPWCDMAEITLDLCPPCQVKYLTGLVRIDGEKT